ncbi:hypothetical protein DFJ77DRAFT_443598 [Powellomyces hirtus]|nr:hypothetical protein DFJ77DRAFT_443598 [Powellomyces hirtus]
MDGASAVHTRAPDFYGWQVSSHRSILPMGKVCKKSSSTSLLRSVELLLRTTSSLLEVCTARAPEQECTACGMLIVENARAEFSAFYHKECFTCAVSKFCATGCAIQLKNNTQWLDILVTFSIATGFPATSIGPLGGQDDYHLCVFWDIYHEEHPDTRICGSCFHPVMVGLPVEVYTNDGVEDWHPFCWKLYEVWNVRLDEYRPFPRSDDDPDVADRIFMQWEDTVQIIFSSLNNLRLGLSRSHDEMLDCVRLGLRNSAPLVLDAIRAQYDFLIEVSGSNNEDLFRLAIDAINAFGKWAALPQCHDWGPVDADDDDMYAEELIMRLELLQVPVEHLLLTTLYRLLHRDTKRYVIDQFSLHVGLLLWALKERLS